MYNIEIYRHKIVHLYNYLIFSDGSSDSDSDVLLAAEDDSKECTMTRKHVELFDRIKKRRRIIEKIDTSDEDAVDTADITHEYFTDMFRAHIKRKKLRRKIRNQPPDQVSAITCNGYKVIGLVVYLNLYYSV